MGKMGSYRYDTRKPSGFKPKGKLDKVSSNSCRLESSGYCKGKFTKCKHRQGILGGGFICELEL